MLRDSRSVVHLSKLFWERHIDISAKDNRNRDIDELIVHSTDYLLILLWKGRNENEQYVISVVIIADSCSDMSLESLDRCTLVRA